MAVAAIFRWWMILPFAATSVTLVAVYLFFGGSGGQRRSMHASPAFADLMRGQLFEDRVDCESYRLAQVPIACSRRPITRLPRRRWRSGTGGDLDETAAAFERAHALDDGYDADSSYGAYLLSTDRTEEALDELRLCVKEEPTHVGVNWSLGAAHLTGHYDDVVDRSRPYGFLKSVSDERRCTSSRRPWTAMFLSPRDSARIQISVTPQ